MIAVHRYRRDLAQPLTAQTIVYPYVLRTLRRETDGPALHALLKDAYAQGFGEVAPRDAWWPALLSDPEFDPDLVFLVETPLGIPVAAAIAWTSGFVKDLVVAPAFRRLGIASVLIEHVCQVCQRRGLPAIELKVDADNHAALALYRSMGMRFVEELRV